MPGFDEDLPGDADTSEIGSFAYCNDFIFQPGRGLARTADRAAGRLLQFLCGIMAPHPLLDRVLGASQHEGCGFDVAQLTIELNDLVAGFVWVRFEEFLEA